MLISVIPPGSNVGKLIRKKIDRLSKVKMSDEEIKAQAEAVARVARTYAAIRNAHRVPDDLRRRPIDC